MNKCLDNSTVKELNIEKYLGVWYEIARFDHRFERGLSKVRAEYILQNNGMIKVLNTGYDVKRDKERLAIGRAKLTDISGLLRVSFFWKFYSDYRVLALDADYKWSLVGAGKSDNYLWILSREENLPKETLEMIISEAQRRGYNTDHLLFSTEV